MFTLLSTPLFTPLGPEFSCCYRPSTRSNTPYFSLILTGALKWSRLGSPSLGGPCEGRQTTPHSGELCRLARVGGACPPRAGLARVGGLKGRNTRHDRRAKSSEIHTYEKRG